MQGISAAISDAVNVFGPLAITSVYAAGGPRPVWIGEMSIIGTCSLIQLLLYRRMVSYTQRAFFNE